MRRDQLWYGGAVVVTVAGVLLGLLVVLLLTVATGYFVAQEFGYMAVDRSRLKAKAATGDAGAARALAITNRTSFMLSGAQLGITVTGLLVGYVAEPLVGAGIGELLGGAGVPRAAGVAIGTVLALLLSTVVQMVFGELFPKNLAIAMPEPVARRLAWSTRLYLRVFGWLIWLFDHASNLLLRAVRIEPVHDVEHAATPRDLEYIVAESRASGDLPAELSTLLDRVLDLYDRTAGHAMVPRPLVDTVTADQPVSEVVELMGSGHTRFPVVGTSVDDVVGMISLRDVLRLDGPEPGAVRAGQLARTAVLVPQSLPLTEVLTRLRQAGDELACVVDEYGGLAGVVTVEDIAEELVGEIDDEHDLRQAAVVRVDDGWLLPGATHVDEVERLIGHDLPAGDYETIAGLLIAALGRLPASGDTATVELPAPPGATPDRPARLITMTVRGVRRHVPESVQLRLGQPPDRAAGSDREERP